jgi:uroporphyrinogen III methyltransferase/synthase
VTGGDGRVFIIGAGPGDASLMTVRGVRLLADADVVVYDKATEAALRWARPMRNASPWARRPERAVAQDAISMLIAEKARDGHTVAALEVGRPVSVRQRRQRGDVSARTGRRV